MELVALPQRKEWRVTDSGVVQALIIFHGGTSSAGSSLCRPFFVGSGCYLWIFMGVGCLFVGMGCLFVGMQCL